MKSYQGQEFYCYKEEKLLQQYFETGSTSHLHILMFEMIYVCMVIKSFSSQVVVKMLFWESKYSCLYHILYTFLFLGYFSQGIM